MIKLADLSTQLGITRKRLSERIRELGIEIFKLEDGRTQAITPEDADTVRGSFFSLAMPTPLDSPEIIDAEILPLDHKLDGLGDQVGGWQLENENNHDRLVEMARKAGERNGKELLTAYAQSSVGKLLEGKTEIDKLLARLITEL